jgi:hypothetical protein
MLVSRGHCCGLAITAFRRGNWLSAIALVRIADVADEFLKTGNSEHADFGALQPVAALAATNSFGTWLKTASERLHRNNACDGGQD